MRIKKGDAFWANIVRTPNEGEFTEFWSDMESKEKYEKIPILLAEGSSVIMKRVDVDVSNTHSSKIKCFYFLRVGEYEFAICDLYASKYFVSVSSVYSEHQFLRLKNYMINVGWKIIS